MNTTMELFEKALTVKPAADWTRQFNLSTGALSLAKKAGRLSPVLAGNFAIELGADVEHWIAVAALEANPNQDLLARLQRHSNRWRKR